MRSLKSELRQYFDALMTPAYGPMATVGNPTADMISVARACVGILEVGDNRSATIDLFEQTCGGNTLGLPWCAAFVQTLIAYVEAVDYVKSTVFASLSCLETWRRSDLNVVQAPIPGDLIVWQHGDSEAGHIGILTGIQSDSTGLLKTYRTIEGNTSDVAGINREGNGVYARLRTPGGTASMRELGFLRAFP